MYAVVGCSECSALWVVEGRPETTRCPRCGSRRQYARLKKFVTTDDGDHARSVRAALLAQRSDHGDAVETVEDFAEMDVDPDEVGMDDEEYLQSAGLDPEAVAAAGERATEGAGGSESRPDVVRSALSDLSDPTREEVLDYADERGVPREAAADLLERLRDRGEVTERDGSYRLL